MVKIYIGKGCVNCHKVVNKLFDYIGEAYVERDEAIVSDVMAKTFGVVPVFEHNNMYYNEYQISSMIDNKFDFTEKAIEIPKVIEKIKITKIKQEE